MTSFEPTQVSPNCQFRIRFTLIILVILCCGLGWSQSATAQDELSSFGADQGFSTPLTMGGEDQAASLSSYCDDLKDKPSANGPTSSSGVASDPLLFESGPTRVKFGLDAVFQQSGVTGSWWNLSEQFAPDAGYKVDRAWAESGIKPGVRVSRSLVFNSKQKDCY